MCFKKTPQATPSIYFLWGAVFIFNAHTKRFDPFLFSFSPLLLKRKRTSIIAEIKITNETKTN